MRRSAAVLLAPILLGSANEPEEAHYLNASLDLDGRLLSWSFEDLDRDGTPELLLALGLAGGERELRVHRLEASGLAREPETTIPVLADVVAWGVADLRDEPGRELLLLTRGGAFSYSPTLSGYRDNARRIASVELIWDQPDPRALPHWEYVLRGDGREAFLLPGRDRLSLWGPDGEGGYRRLGELATDDVDASLEELAGDGAARGGGPRFEADDASPFLSEGASSSLLSDARSYRAPAMVDVDGDGFLDLVVAGAERVAVHLGTADGPSAEPTRVEELPEKLREASGDDSDEDERRSVELALVHLDDDPFLDVVAIQSDEADGLENRVQRVLLYRGAAERLFAEEPFQVLRFESADLEVHVADVDGDGRRDLAVERFVMPSLMGAVTGLEFSLELSVHPGGERGFARRPALATEESYDVDTAIELAASRAWKLDCDGDGTADLVEIDLKGNVTIRRVRAKRSRLRGASLSLDETPWKEFEVEGSIESLTVADVNGDGLGDVVSAGDERLMVLLSVRGGGRR